MDIRDYVRILRTSWVLLLLGVLLGGGAAAAGSSLVTPQYEARTQLFVSTTGSGDLATAVQGNYYAESKVASYAELLRSKELAAAVIDDLSLDLTPQQLMDEVQASVVTDTTILDVVVTDASPERAVAIASSIDARFAALVRQLETPAGESVSPVRVAVIATPELPRSASSPAVVPNIALGTVVGLVLMGAVAVLRDVLDTTVKDDSTAAEAAGAPVIGRVPIDPQLAAGRPVDAQNTAAAEAVRHVRTNLAFLDVDSPPRVIMVTSAVSGEGKTTLAVNLALALAESGKTVTLVEADLRRPKVTRRLGLVGGVGLTNVLTGDAGLDDVIQHVGDGVLQVLASGPVPPNPSELLSSAAMARLVERLVATRDIVVIDAPPVLPVTDAAAMAGVVDGVLLAARWGTVTTEQVRSAAAVLGRVGVKVFGVVLTVVPLRSTPAAYSYEAEPETVRGSRQGRRRWLPFRSRPVGPLPAPQPSR